MIRVLFTNLKHKNDDRRVWLLFFDLYLRKFLKRDPKERELEKQLYLESDLQGQFFIRSQNPTITSSSVNTSVRYKSAHLVESFSHSCCGFSTSYQK